MWLTPQRELVRAEWPPNVVELRGPSRKEGRSAAQAWCFHSMAGSQALPYCTLARLPSRSLKILGALPPLPLSGDRDDVQPWQAASDWAAGWAHRPASAASASRERAF